MKRSILPLACLLLAACAAQPPRPDAPAAGALPVVAERYVSTLDPQLQIDSVASWRSPDGGLRLFASAKEGGRLFEFDAVDGRVLREIRGAGNRALERPNGIAVVDDLLFAVERDRREVQVFRLPGAEPLGGFGADLLRFPYGLWVQRLDHGHYAVFVTDSFQHDDGSEPDGEVFRQRVRRFELADDGRRLTLLASASFGAEEAPGALHWVESIFGDPTHDRLLVAEEKLDHGSGLAIYRIDGSFTGDKISSGVFSSQAEGIALRACADGSGHWIASDQHPHDQRFHVFDRESLELQGSFEAVTTRMTDGLWFEPGPAPGFEHGVLFAQHDDRAVVAFDWADIATALGLARDCP